MFKTAVPHSNSSNSRNNHVYASNDGIESFTQRILKNREDCRKGRGLMDMSSGHSKVKVSFAKDDPISEPLSPASDNAFRHNESQA